MEKLNEEIEARLERYQDRRDDLELRRARLPKVTGLAVIDRLRMRAEELLEDVERDLARLGEEPFD
jgi:predicted nuclease with TOPRIM domain